MLNVLRCEICVHYCHPRPFHSSGSTKKILLAQILITKHCFSSLKVGQIVLQLSHIYVNGGGSPYWTADIYIVLSFTIYKFLYSSVIVTDEVLPRRLHQTPFLEPPLQAALYNCGHHLKIYTTLLTLPKAPVLDRRCCGRIRLGRLISR